ncbi:MAG: type II toxin-antitoxin system VapC family toxin [Chloroflexi bacterium]|jgi:predicted nucleic acid-binding protein|nr:type II toxin-antitoxin system VapC family toxin [Chloroflexota bacterium]
MRVVIDTSVFVGMLVPNDVWHSQAIELYQTLVESGDEVIFLDCVIAESISVITRRLREKRQIVQADDILNRIMTQFPAELITWVLPDVPTYYAEIVALVQASAHRLNFNDALIATVCSKRQIEAIASFDSGFDLIATLKRLC